MVNYQNIKARLNDEMNGNGLTTFLIASLIYYIGTQIMGQFPENIGNGRSNIYKFRKTIYLKLYRSLFE